jgi:hypothetical protein
MVGCVTGLLLLMRGSVYTQEAFSTISTVHIDVHYQRGVSEEDARKAADFLQEEYKYISDQLGLDLKKKLDVRIYDTVGK